MHVYTEVTVLHWDTQYSDMLCNCLVSQMHTLASPHTLSLQPKTPDKVKHFRGMTQPEAGKQRVFHSFAADPSTAKGISHGVSTRTSLQASDLVNPSPKSLFEHLMQEKSEQVYASKKTAPLGTYVINPLVE